MRTLLLTLTLLTLAATANAQDVTIWDYVAQAQEASVERHPKANEPVQPEDLGITLMPPYFAQKYLRGERYSEWALTWNAIKDEEARRSGGERVLYGSTTRITNTTNGTIREVTPRIWTIPIGTPGEIRYNPFVTPGS